MRNYYYKNQQKILKAILVAIGVTAIVIFAQLLALHFEAQFNAYKVMAEYKNYVFAIMWFLVFCLVFGFVLSNKPDNAVDNAVNIDSKKRFYEYKNRVAKLKEELKR